MIKNDEQLRITQEQIQKFETALEQAISNPDPTLHPLLVSAQIAALQSQLDDLRAEVTAFEAHRIGQSTLIKLSSLAELPQVLIKARQAVGLTRSDLALRLGLTEPEISEYEATEYASVRFARLAEVAEALGLGSPTMLLLGG